MKGFGKFVTFVGVTGAALAGLWYFCEVNKDKGPACSCDDDAEGTECKKNNERSYVSLDPELKESAKKIADDVKTVADDVKTVAGEVKDAARDGKDTLKKAVKSAAQDIIKKGEEAAKGVGLVKDDKKTSDFEFEDFDKDQDAASHIDIQ